MHVKDLIYNYNIGNLELIKKQCGLFIDESNGLPIMKNLPQTYKDFQKVKVRKRKHTNIFSNTFNGAFKDELNDLRERAIFVNGLSTFEENKEDEVEPFYIFPINGFKFLYSKEVKNSTKNYKQVFESIFCQMGEESGKEVLTDLLRFTYVSENFSAGIATGAEIILYGIPFYYALRQSHVDNYDKLLTMLDGCSII